MSGQKYNVNVRVTISSGSYGSDRLSVDEELTVSAADFMEVCSVLGQFHALAEKIRAQQEVTS